jgi:hypothetical protein
MQHPTPLATLNLLLMVNFDSTMRAGAATGLALCVVVVVVVVVGIVRVRCMICIVLCALCARPSCLCCTDNRR